MLGVLYSAASDFATFSYPRSLGVFSGICLENHATAIEARYCPRQHVLQWNDTEWEKLVAQEEHFLDALEKSDDSFYQDLFCSPPMPPSEACSTPSASVLSTPSLVPDNLPEDSEEHDECKTDPGADSDSDYEEPRSPTVTLKLPLTDPVLPVLISDSPSSPALSSNAGVKRKRRKGGNNTVPPPKRICRVSSSNSVATVSTSSSAASSRSSSSAPSTTSTHLIMPTEARPGENPWKCPHCPWIQHTHRLPDFQRHIRSHFVSKFDWPCPNPECGKNFARKDSLKRHLDNRATGCKRPPGYIIC